MAEAHDPSRTEPASARRLQAARRVGDVPRSAELSAWLILFSALAGLFWLAPALFSALGRLIEAAFRQAAHPDFPHPVLDEALYAALWAAVPLLVLAFFVTLIAPVVLSGWVTAPSALQMRTSRFAPLRAFSRLLSAEGGFDGGLGLLKLLLVAGALAWVGMPGAITDIFQAATWVGQGLIAVVGALALAAALDAGWRWWRYLRRHAMTPQEVLAEARESEISPELRARIRRRQQQTGQGRAGGPGAGPAASPFPEGGGANDALRTPKTLNEVIG